MNLHLSPPQSLSTEDLVRRLYDDHQQGSILTTYSSTPVSHPLITSRVSSSKKEQNPTIKGKGNGITYSLNRGRLGDNLCSYLHAKWLAYKYHLPLYYRSFPHSDQFRFSDEHQRRKKHSKQFKTTLKTADEELVNSGHNAALFEIIYFPDNTEHIFHEGVHSIWNPAFQVDWEDPGFQAEVRRSLAPKYPVFTPDLPTDSLTIGVHVRRGGGFDSLQERMKTPLKFPPDSYYIQQIDRISKIFKNYRLYVYILTDDQDPASIANTYQAALNNPHIRFDYRKTPNGPSTNILEDFFFIPKFDCLIICQSNFSLMASKLADFALVITPTHPTLINGQAAIDEVKLTFNGKKRISGLALINSNIP